MNKEEFIKPREDIYKETISYFTLYDESYIRSILDSMYGKRSIYNDVSVSGWIIFVGEILIGEVLQTIHMDTVRAKNRLLLAKCFTHHNDLCSDIQETISSYI